MVIPAGQIAYILLVVLMGTGWGAVSFWAAASKVHWFVRLAGVVLPLCVFLRVPAAEPVLFFALQSIVITFAISFSSRDKANGFTFSLRWLLMATVVASLLLAVFARTSVSSLWTWASLVSGSVSLGIATLLAAWTTQSFRWSKLIISAGCLAVSAVPMGLSDSLLINFPEWDKGISSLTLFGSAATASQIAIASLCIWCGVLLLSYLLQVSLLSLLQLARSRHNDSWMWLGRVGFAALLTLIVVPVTWVYAHIQPAVSTRKEAESLRGYELFDAARDHIFITGPIDFPDQATDQQLAAAIQKNEKAIAMFREIAKLPVEPPTDWAINSILNDTQFLRSVARVFEADAILARRQGRFGDAVDRSLETIHLSRTFSDTNLMTGLVGIAIEAIGQNSLGQVRVHLDESQAQRAIKGLRQLDETALSIEKLHAAETAWAQRTWGWRKQLYDALSAATGHDELQEIESAITVATSRSAVVRRLLIIDLAIRNYRRQNGGLPNALAELNLDSELLIDEFTSDRSMISYRTAGDTYTLYSVGPNGIDNGGEPIGDEEWDGDGDYMLDSLYPKKTVVTPSELE